MVSEDRLRAELAEQELRLRADFANSLQGKVSTPHFQRLEGEIREFRHETSDALDEIKTAALSPEGVKAMIASALDDASARGWTSRERWMAVALFLITLASFTINLYSATQ